MMDFFYNSICHVCKEYKKDAMKRCGSCKFITYCCKEHQITDWKKHKQICNLLASSQKIINLNVNCEYNQWRSNRTFLQLYLKQSLKRELLPYENQMWMFPRACAKCYVRENLKDCENCLCVAYCSSKHQTIHKELHDSVCSSLKLCLDYDRYYSKVEAKAAKEIKLIEIKTDIRHLPDNIQDCMENIVDMSNFSDSLDKIYASDTFAIMLTIIYGLEQCNILKDRKLKTSNLVVHIVGTDILELMTDWNLNFQLLNNWIKNLDSCKFLFIGPDCIWNESPKYDCKNIKIEYVNDFYHNVKNNDDADLIVTFNSGLHEFEFDSQHDTWKKSLRKLIDNKAPLVITSYTKQELEEDFKRFNSYPKKIIKHIEKNPYSNLRPIRDWDSELCTPFYVNGYIAILAGILYHE